MKTRTPATMTNGLGSSVSEMHCGTVSVGLPFESM